MPRDIIAKAFLSTGADIKDYTYQRGFGNRFSSEAVPDVLPKGRNAPQRVKYDLYSEQLNGSSFIAPRRDIRHVWMYRIRPSVSHGRVSASEMNTYIESVFSSANQNVETVASQESWDPFPLPSRHTGDGIDFVCGIRTVGGQGDPTLREGLAVHIYSADSSMNKSAFCNNDGDLLIIPQTGRLDIQTELGWMMVHPGEIAVIQAGIRFRVLLLMVPLEVFGGHYDLPELGPLGSNGLALPQDFQSPCASFDLDNSNWRIVYKLAGQLHACNQNHTPFDVVAWQGNLVPYKYAIEKFVNLANVEKDQADPTIYCVLTAKSKIPGVSLTDFLIFTPKWITTSNTFRPPYYHRNMSTEIMGLIYGEYGGSSHKLEPGGLSYEASYMPHGETYETWRRATTRELAPERICEGTAAFMFHVSVPIFLTKWVLEGEGARTRHSHRSQDEQLDSFQSHFLNHVEEVNLELEAAGLPPLTSSEAKK
ncbi:unnamed protein product [Clonostachys rosea]|uniref:homogentisate 1,2-dioxygenase n=1 Tax=Bionectria ochroleuca TaxID=29856 RepID=A0ABY6TQH8_BIOOC|nr:unnamed protein product [Clonostachys rosea]